MNWFFVAVSAYFILAVVYLIDKYLLAGPIPNPKVYAFYVGILGLVALFLIPFVGFYYPGFFQVFLAFLSGTSFIFSLFWFFKAIRLFEVSRIVPAVGGILPVFSYLLVFIFSWGKERFFLQEFFAFLLLVFGSVFIAYKPRSFSKKSWAKSLPFSAAAAFFLALSFVLAKYVYLSLPFWTGYIWIRMGGGLAALIFLVFSSELKKELFEVKMGMQRKTTGIFLTNQAAGALSNILQNWSIALAPLAYVAIINALQGIQYVFLLVFAVLFSLKFPQLLKEEISREIILQKIVAILLIGAGLAILAFL